jgi:magnesium chelatase family protein
MKPCNCGFAGDQSRRCICSAAEILKYRGRLSGPLADRIDMHVAVSALPLNQLGSRARGESSADIRVRVEQARHRQRSRYGNGPGCNARAPGRWLELHDGLSAPAHSLLTTAGERLELSARGFHRVLRVARTIADLDGDTEIGTPHVAEALGYRPRVVETSRDELRVG